MSKRSADLLLVLSTAPIWVPLLLLAMLLVRIWLGSPVFFRQQRAGLHGTAFSLIKLRSMTDERGAGGELLPNEKRLTAFGRWLRSTSLDELPELINVLAGEMSLVGPRPLGLRYVKRYSNEQRRRLEVLPGLTGWAQVNGRNSLSWDERFKLDVWYVEHQTLWLDLKILLLSVFKILKREGIYAEGEAIMPEFTGSQPAADDLNSAARQDSRR